MGMVERRCLHQWRHGSKGMQEDRDHDEQCRRGSRAAGGHQGDAALDVAPDCWNTTTSKTRVAREVTRSSTGFLLDSCLGGLEAPTHAQRRALPDGQMWP